MSILDSELADALTDALIENCIPQSCVVRRSMPDPNAPSWDPGAITGDHPCCGWRDEYSAIERANSDVQQTDVKIFLLASSLDIAPAPGDRITITGATRTIVNVALDAAGACWTCQCRT